MSNGGIPLQGGGRRLSPRAAQADHLSSDLFRSNCIRVYLEKHDWEMAQESYGPGESGFTKSEWYDSRSQIVAGQLRLGGLSLLTR